MMANYSIATWVLGAALLLLALALIALPLLTRASRREDVNERLEALQQEQTALLRQLRALDDDVRAGKLSATDHAELRANLIARGATVLRELAEHGEARDVSY